MADATNTEISKLLDDFHNASGSMSSSISSLAHKLEQRNIELKEMEHALGVKKMELEKKHDILVAKEKKILQRGKRVDERELKWKEIEAQMASNAEKMISTIKLNVGGRIYVTSKHTLLQFKGSLFEYLICSNHIQLTKDGEIFIDHDPTYFNILLNFMREGKLRITDIKSTNLEELENEFKFFNIPFPLVKIPENIVREAQKGTPPLQPHLVGLQAPKEVLVAIAAWLPLKRFLLIYKASRDGFSSAAFHKACDNQGATLTVIQSSDGFIFGGFSPLPWSTTDPNNINNNSKYFSHPHSFLFTLTNPHAIPPTRYNLREGDPLAICYRFSHCSIFGGGYDMCLGSDSNRILRNSYFHFPCSYVDSTGKGSLTFTGHRNFLSREVEVYSVM